MDWFVDAGATHRQWDHDAGTVHTGFYNALRAVWGVPLAKGEVLPRRLVNRGNKTIWITGHSLGGALRELSWWAAAVTLFFAALGLLVQLPGVGGGYQVGTIQALRQIFHVRPEGATSAGILMWIITLVPCVLLGVLLLLYEGLSFRKLGLMARLKRAEAEVRTGAPDA